MYVHLIFYENSDIYIYILHLHVHVQYIRGHALALGAGSYPYTVEVEGLRLQDAGYRFPQLPLYVCCCVVIGHDTV